MRLLFTSFLSLFLSFSLFGQSPCNNQTSVTYQGYEYDIVEIGEQCWFAENCRYLPEVSPSSASSSTNPYYYVYEYQGTDVSAAIAIDNYETYGVLYNWSAVMTDSICPSGWHIPSDEEFTQLTDFLGGEDVAGGKMKEAGSDHFLPPNTGATNSSGWTGLPGGYQYSGDFYFSSEVGMWWSASESGFNSWGRALDYNYDEVISDIVGDYQLAGLSARCIQNDPITTIFYPESSPKKLEKVLDALGREVNHTTNQILFYIYDDGSVEKKFIVE